MRFTNMAFSAGLRKLMVVAGAALLATTASAQAPLCKNRGFIDSVYQVGLGGSDYEYYIQIRNQTSQPMRWELSFANFPKDVTLFSPRLTGGTLQPFASEQIKFGRGNNGNISSNTVERQYDTASGTKPYALMSRCI